jgi:hypothetical protein
MLGADLGTIGELRTLYTREIGERFPFWTVGVGCSGSNSVGSLPVTVNVGEGAQELDPRRNFEKIEYIMEWREYSVTARHHHNDGERDH